MTPETIAYCRRYVNLSTSLIDQTIDIRVQEDNAEQVVCLHAYLNRLFARQFEYAELKQHCNAIIAAYEQIAA
jgi:hypothetical protein